MMKQVIINNGVDHLALLEHHHDLKRKVGMSCQHDITSKESIGILDINWEISTGSKKL